MNFKGIEIEFTVRHWLNGLLHAVGCHRVLDERLARLLVEKRVARYVEPDRRS